MSPRARPLGPVALRSRRHADAVWSVALPAACAVAWLLCNSAALAAVPPPLPPMQSSGPPSATQPPADTAAPMSPDAAARQGISELMRSAYYWLAHYRPDITRNVLEKVLHVRADHAQALLLLGETELRLDRADAARKVLAQLTAAHPGSGETAELRQLLTLYTEQRNSLDQLRQLRQRGRTAEVLALARRLFPDGRPPGSLASEYASVLAAQIGGWEKSRLYLEQRIARSPAPRDRLALAELDAQRPATRARGLASLSRLADEAELPADQLRRSWSRAIDTLGNTAQAQRERQALARALPIEPPAPALPGAANPAAALVASAAASVSLVPLANSRPTLSTNPRGSTARSAAAPDGVEASRASPNAGAAPGATSTSGEPPAAARTAADTAARAAAARPEPPSRSQQVQAQAQALLDADRPATARSLLLDHLASVAPAALGAEGATRGLLGLAEMRLGRNDLAREHFIAALAGDPDDADRWRSLRDTADFWGTLAAVRAALAARTVNTSQADAAQPAPATPAGTPAGVGTTASRAAGGAASPAAELDALDHRLVRALDLPSALGHEREALLLRTDIKRQLGRGDLAAALVDPLCRADLAAAAAAPPGTSRDTRACELSLAVRSNDRDIDAALTGFNAEAARLGPGALALLAQALDVGALRELADQRVEAGRRADARRLLENTLALRPLEPWLRYDLARLLQAQGHAVAARGLMRQGLALLPAHPAAPGGNDITPSRAYVDVLPDPGGAVDARPRRAPARAADRAAPAIPRSPAELEMRRAAVLVAFAGDDSGEAIALLSPDGDIIDTELYARARYEAARQKVRRLLARFQPGVAGTSTIQGAAIADADVAPELELLEQGAVQPVQRPAILPPRRFSTGLQGTPSGAPAQRPPRAVVGGLGHGDEAELERALQQVAALAGNNPDRLAEVQRLRAGQRGAVEHQSQVEIGMFEGQRHASAGRGELGSRELTLRVSADSTGFGPLGPSVRDHLPAGRWWAQLDHSRLDAGTLPAAWAEAQDFGRVRQLGGAVPVPVDLPADVRQRADGLALGLGWERGEQQADLGLVGLGMAVPRWVGGWRWDRWGEDGTHLGVEIARRAETGTLLAWAGAVDPVSGQAWGGVNQTALVLRGGLALLPPVGPGQTGWLGDRLREVSLDSSLRLGRMDGRNTAGNGLLQWRGSLGLRFIDRPSLRLGSGLNLDLWRYQRNEGFYSWGHGGYYSPQRYASISLPLTLDARGPAWTLALRAGLSRSRTREDDVAYFPTDAAAQAAAGNPVHAGGPGGGVGASLRALGEWQFASQWRLGLTLGLEQSSDYAPRRFGLYLRHGLGEQPAPADFPLRPLGSYTRF
ncbi:MAG: hypothetical protein RIQ60_2093 [Pseudomonadota bacterium]|jgi:tetratricopeptide (TPR) repeat protein